MATRACSGSSSEVLWNGKGSPSTSSPGSGSMTLKRPRYSETRISSSTTSAGAQAASTSLVKTAERRMSWLGERKIARRSPKMLSPASSNALCMPCRMIMLGAATTLSLRSMRLIMSNRSVRVKTTLPIRFSSWPILRSLMVRRGSAPYSSSRQFVTNGMARARSNALASALEKKEETVSVPMAKEMGGWNRWPTSLVRYVSNMGPKLVRNVEGRKLRETACMR
mmetsp:Transcript_17992/g.41589  ORF Transcript_17992/g.41589 Transcript_17992/m.41589 type:complete len:224 (-) Transcript_17992:188-859(-)